MSVETPPEALYRSPVAVVSYDAENITEALGVYRLVRDICARHGFPDRGRMRFDMRLEFGGLGEATPKELESALRDLNISVSFRSDKL